MTFEKLFMKTILPELMFGAVLGINLLVMLMLPDNLIGLLGLMLSSGIIAVAAAKVYNKLYRSWLSTKQDEIIERLRQRAKAEGKEENLDITLRYMEANGVLADY